MGALLPLTGSAMRPPGKMMERRGKEKRERKGKTERDEKERELVMHQSQKRTHAQLFVPVSARGLNHMHIFVGRNGSTPLISIATRDICAKPTCTIKCVTEGTINRISSAYKNTLTRADLK